MTRDIFLLLGILMMTTHGSGQGTLDEIKHDLYNINKLFDSARFLAFDTDIYFNTDTILGKFEADHEFVSYILDGKKIFYRTATAEFMQNDSFTITANEAENMLVVTRRKLSSKSALFPLRDFVDSIISHFVQQYQINITKDDSMKVIGFSGMSENLPFNEVMIRYRPGNYLLEEFNMTYTEATKDESIEAPAGNDIRSATRPLRKRISMRFYNYRVTNDMNVFDESNYLYFDNTRKAYLANGKYKSYKLVGTNLETAERIDNDIETIAPPVDPDEN